LAQNILNISCFPYPQSYVVERQVTVLSDDLDPPTKSISAASALLAASLGRAIADLTLTAEAKILEFAPR
jgi:hypothetical protein